MTVDSETPRVEMPKSRRAILAGAAGGLAGLILGGLGRPSETKAAAGDPIIMGIANHAGVSNTTIETTSPSPGIALQMNNQGTGTGAFMLSTGGVGLAAQTSSANKYGASVTNQGAAGGTGGAILATGKQNNGLVATTDNNSKYAVQATGANGTAIYGSAIQIGIQGVGYRGIYGTTTAGFFAVGVSGNGGTGTDNVGVYGEVNNATGKGVYGINHANSSTSFGVYGKTEGTDTDATGVRGVDNGGAGITNGVKGTSSSSFGTGVWGETSVDNTNAFGVYGIAAGAGKGVVGSSITGYALYGFGNGLVTGSFSKASGTFRIDHPLDPANKFLQHSFVESPDMMNVYNGNTKLGSGGTATVALPDWFGALNRDFRYQLTAIGAAAPNLHVKSGVKDNSFSIAGGAAGQEVSWQVTGIRQDAWAKAHPVEVEVAKTGTEKGRYLHPAEHGQAASKGIARISKKTAG